MVGSITREMFQAEAARLAAGFAGEAWDEVVEKSGSRRLDEWMRERGCQLLRDLLGRALSARGERLGVSGSCRSCDATVEFRERRPVTLHTVLAGRDVEVRIPYGQCRSCGSGRWPILEEMGVDAEGFSVALQELTTLAGVMEPYESASEELLGRFAGVAVSRKKIVSLVRENGEDAVKQLKEEPSDEAAGPSPGEAGQRLYVGIDGGMIFVDRRWQEVKVGCLFQEEEATDLGATRPALYSRNVVAVRGDPSALATQLWPSARRVGAMTREVVVLGDGAPWIWNLAAEHFPGCVEVLDWYHAHEHVSDVARTLYGEGSDKATAWRETQLERLRQDRVDDVIEGLEFLTSRQKSQAKRKKIDELKGYLFRNRTRMLYKTFRERGLRIGSGAVESAVSHVVQHRMKRVGMRWKSTGADAMLALRSVYRSSGAWSRFWNRRNAVA